MTEPPQVPGDAERGVDRRTFLTGAAMAGGVAAGSLALPGLFDQRADAAERPTVASRHHRYRQPNIVFIVVDEMRFPQVFPRGVHTPGEFLRRYMPHLHELWSNGVKFGRHYTAGAACSPGRACFVTGLYPLQNLLLQTRTGTRTAPVPSPAMGRGFPTYGRLLRHAGYETPYVGKWHLSPSPDEDSNLSPGYLEAYGFDGLTEPDIVGNNGDGYNFDADIARQAAAWLSTRKRGQSPFCLTVSFVNPHDKQFFWAGTEADKYNALYEEAGLTPQRSWTQVDAESTPPRRGYPVIPPNWEPQRALADKPTTQTFVRQFQSLVWGGVTDRHHDRTDYELRPYGTGSDPDRNVAYAPWGYWERALDSYTQVLSMVDANIGTVLRSIPREVAKNTVFVMTSDHGEFAGAHGMVSGKLGTAYEEAFHIPLIVADPTGRFTGDTDRLRTGQTSSVDVLPMLVTLGHGDRSWMRGDLARIYHERHDLMPMLRSRRAHGRHHVLLSTNEHAPSALNYNNSPLHIYAMRTEEYKVAVYAGWHGATAHVDPDTFQYEFYDYATERGRLELDNTYEHDRRAQRAAQRLMRRYVPGELAAPLPRPYRLQSRAAMARYLTYIQVIDRLNDRQLDNGGLALWTPYGEVF